MAGNKLEFIQTCITAASMQFSLFCTIPSQSIGFCKTQKTFVSTTQMLGFYQFEETFAKLKYTCNLRVIVRFPQFGGSDGVSWRDFCYKVAVRVTRAFEVATDLTEPSLEPLWANCKDKLW